MSPRPELQTENEARFLKLEEKIAYQEKLIAELNEVVVSLHRRTDELDGRVQALERVLRAELGARDMPNEKPPHY
jgi:SlyX protein